MKMFEYKLPFKARIEREMTPEEEQEPPVPEARRLAEENPGKMVLGWRVDEEGKEPKMDVRLLEEL